MTCGPVGFRHLSANFLLSGIVGKILVLRPQRSLNVDVGS